MDASRELSITRRRGATRVVIQKDVAVLPNTFNHVQTKSHASGYPEELSCCRGRAIQVVIQRTDEQPLEWLSRRTGVLASVPSERSAFMFGSS
jgi:hypothetical protein